MVSEIMKKKKDFNWVSSITCLKRTNENPFILNQHIFFREKPFLLFFYGKIKNQYF